MRITIPIYLEGGAKVGGYTARPLFFSAPVERGVRLNRVTSRLVGAIRQHLDALGAEARHDQLAAWSFNPPMEALRQTVTIQLRARATYPRLFVVSMRALGRRIAFCPRLPDIWFDYEKPEEIWIRAREVLTEYYRGLEREDEDVKPEEAAMPQNAWLSTITVDVTPPAVYTPPPNPLLALLGAPPPMDGERELRRVGRCLDWLYPDDLDRVVGRDAELAALNRLLAAPDRRPVLLVGPHLVGKTALLHEHVYHAVKARKAPYVRDRNVWWLSPPRLISGMSFVGQWEQRLLAILQEAETRQHLLYVDDMIGLFTAGTHRDSVLSMAHVLKPWLEARRVRIVGEATEPALAALQELDRGFADMFHLMRVAPTDEAATRRIGVQVMRQLEGQHRCRFGVDALPAVIDLSRRYQRAAAFPGKAAVFLHQLAIKHQKVDVDRAAVLKHFSTRSGLSISVLDDRAKLPHADVVADLSRRVTGQTAAVRALADAISLTKARLADPERPLASLLFLGPTGVGKTHTAKAVAELLYGSAERLVRFDLNEFSSGMAVARLVGTRAAPEGLLTAAVRRQPWCVLLLDEIEKAHPAVFNLLLQVMGDGRLTDALGRTADFTGVLLIMTSNLGVAEAGRSLGFRTGTSRRAQTYVRAAERFFAPEFFNRLDRVVPFEPLSRAEVQHIATRLMRDVLSREGLVRRQCILQVAPEAMDQIVEEGYHPDLGARALKRAVERGIVQRIAGPLAAMPPHAPAIIRVRGAHEVQVTPLQAAAPAPDLLRVLETLSPAEVARRLARFVARMEAWLAARSPSGPVDAATLRPEELRYFTLHELLRRLARRVEGLEGRAPRPRGKVRPELRREPLLCVETPLPALLSHQDVLAEMRALKPVEHRDVLADVAGEAALLQALSSATEATPAALAAPSIPDQRRGREGPPASLDAPALPDNGEVRFSLRSLEAAEDHVPLQKAWLGQTGDSLEVTRDADGTLVAHGIAARLLLQREAGIHLMAQADGKMAPIELSLGDGAQNVVRIYDPRSLTIDLRSGWMVKGLPGPRELAALMRTALPLPEELR